MPYPASAVAYELVETAIKNGSPISQMKLQKLLYLAHGIYLAQYDKPLIKESFQAWKYGPVIPSIYDQYKFYGSEPISNTTWLKPFYNNTESIELDNKSVSLINNVLERTKNISAGQLSNWTHKENSPWYKNFREGVYDIIIPNKEIKDYFIEALTPNAVS